MCQIVLPKQVRPVLTWQVFHSSHKFETAPQNPELINRNNCAKNSFNRSWSAQKCIDNFRPPLLLSVPRDNGLKARKLGVRFCKFDHHQFSDSCPILLVVCHYE